MKRRIVLIISFIVVVAGVSIWFAINKRGSDKSNEAAGMSIEQLSSVCSILRATTTTEITQWAQENKVTLEESEYGCVIRDVSCNSFVMNADFVKDKTEITYLDGAFSCEIKGNDSRDFVPKKLEEFGSICSAIFGVDIVKSDYHIYDEQGRMLDMENEKSYESVLAGKAKITLYVREADKGYWIIESRKSEDVFEFTFVKRFDTETYGNATADITLE